jgi:serine/threonine protein kinase
MDLSRWQQIEEIFSASSDIAGTARDEFLRSACHGDEELLFEVNKLLREHDCPSSILDGSSFEIGLKLLDQREVVARIGSNIGRFRIGRLMGRGGMGSVYEAWDTENDRTVAIKLVNEIFALDPERIRRFRKEANAASRVSHPNVPKLYELVEFDNEHLIVMEFVEGVSLRQFMADPIPPEKSLDIAAQIASALVAAHSAGVVHRDIKPENIILTPDGTVKVLDFGLAKLVDPIGAGAIHIPGDDDGKLTVDMSTELGALMGTPAYMSPEQIRGAGVDTQSDIWSLGVLLYEMLSGKLPFQGSTKIDLIAAVLLSEPTPIQIANIATTGKIKGLLQKSLCKEKSSRYLKAKDLLTDLHSIRNALETRIDASPARRGLRKRSTWNYITAAVVAIAVLILVLPASRRLAASYLIGRYSKTVPPQIGLVDDAVAEFSIASNPNGNWSYGFTPLNDIGPFSLFTFTDHNKYLHHEAQEVPVDTWRNQDPIRPLIMHNTSGTTIKTDGVLVLSPEMLHLHPGKDRQRSVLRWTARANGIYQFQGQYQGIDLKGTSSDIAIVQNSSLILYRENITGYGDSKSFQLSKLIAKGDTIDFSVGDGGNGFFNDETGLSVSVLTVSLFDIMPPSGLVSYWPADGNANDIVGSNNGDLLNGATYRPGVSGQAFSFGGADDLMQAPTKDLPTGSMDRTLALWVKVDDFSDWESFFGAYGQFGSNDQVYQLGADGNDLFVTNWGKGSVGAYRLKAGRWYYVVAATHENLTELYLDGVLLESANFISFDTPPDTMFYCGRIPGELGERRRLKGAVDEIQVYDRALSAEEIQTLFLQFKPPDE